MNKWTQSLGVLLPAMLINASAVHAVVLGQIDTFQDSSLANFGGGTLAIASGGPAGAADKFLEVSSNGQDGPGSKLITYNRSQWLGDYNAAGVTQISMDLKNLGSNELFVRIAFKDGVGPGAAGYSYSSPFILPANDAWSHAAFALDESDFTPIYSPSESLATLLSDPLEFRILSSSSPALDGDVTLAALGIDNISAGPAVVPEPASIPIVASAGAMLLSRRNRRDNRRDNHQRVGPG